MACKHLGTLHSYYWTANPRGITTLLLAAMNLSVLVWEIFARSSLRKSSSIAEFLGRLAGTALAYWQIFLMTLRSGDGERSGKNLSSRLYVSSIVVYKIWLGSLSIWRSHHLPHSGRCCVRYDIFPVPLAGKQDQSELNPSLCFAAEQVFMKFFALCFPI